LFVGIIGPSRSSTSEKVLSVVKNTDIPVISPYATFPDLRNSQNFLRTIPSDDDQVMASIF
jgi:ABC-type branched-subunit amino acid transport system substrate-binding protein